MPVVQFGGAESLGAVALRGAVGGRSAYIAPNFGGLCVCCNADAMGRTQDYDPSTDRVRADPVPMPVCFDCRKHALQTHTGPIMVGAGLCVGIASTALGFMYLDKRPEDTFLWGMVAFGVVVTGSALAWIVKSHKRQKQHLANGHHAGLLFSVGHGRTLLTTTNDALVDDLLERNPGAIRTLTRAEKRRLPRAKAVRRD